MSLGSTDVGRFITDGFIRIEDAFARSLADRARAILWRDTGCDAEDSSTWTKPVVWLGEYGDEPFRLAGNAPALTSAYDAMMGAGRWLPPLTLGSFQVRFPSGEPADGAAAFAAASSAAPRSRALARGYIGRRAFARLLIRCALA